MDRSTFYALSTVSGKSGVAVVRVSGPKSIQLIKDLGYTGELFPRFAAFHKLKHPITKEVLDECIFIYFKAPNSFTGEDILELHLHGSKAVIKDVLAALSGLSYLRIAQPGEFSKQAFFNGKMDLTQAEGLVELIESETTIQRQVALRQVSGEVFELYEDWRQQVIMMLSQAEALIDFPDDEIPLSTLKLIGHRLDMLRKDMEKHLDDSNDLSVLAEGIKVVISGPPNAGKSSLMNYLAKSEVAIVSEIAGTTRDSISLKVDLAGFPVIITDTAGIRDNSSDVIENKGISIAKREAGKADINIILLAANQDNKQFMSVNRDLFKGESIVLFNKIDCLSPNENKKIVNLLEEEFSEYKYKYLISIKEDYGVYNLLDSIKELVKNKYTPSSSTMLTNLRYRESIQKCLSHLNSVNPYNGFIEIMAEELRFAADSIGGITGKIHVEEVLDQIFSSFCIGK